jgi:hypothetical protein
MTLAANIDMVSLALKGLIVLALLASGIRLLVQSKRARRPATVVNGRVVAKGLQRMVPIVRTQPQPRLVPGAELGRLADVIQTARVRIDTITTCQRSAARHLDSAEVALNRLLADIVGVMPKANTSVVLVRQSPMAMAA